MQTSHPGLSVENERLVEDLQDRLEEARAEVLQRRKDEKEMKGKEKAQLIQITGVSFGVLWRTLLTESSSKRTFRASKRVSKILRPIMRACRRCTTHNAVSFWSTANPSIRQSADRSTDEAQRLRDLLRDRDAVVKELEIGIQAHEADEKKVCPVPLHFAVHSHDHANPV